MGSFPTRSQWLIVIAVNILISAITTILVVRVMTRPAEVIDPVPLRPAAVATRASPEATPRAPAAPATSTPITTATAVAPTPTRPAPTPTAVPASALDKVAIVISNINFPGQRQRESVVIANEGDTVDLKGWTLASPRGVVYTFGNVSLFKDNFINIYTTTGADIATDLFMNRAEAAWQVGDVVTISRDGRSLATYTIKP